MAELADDCSVFLVPEQTSVGEMLAHVQPMKPQLFEMELASWNRDRLAWPPERTAALFDASFELHKGYLRKKYLELERRLGSP